MRGHSWVFLALVCFFWFPAGAVAAPGDLLGTVELPGNGFCSVAGTFDGTNYMTTSPGASGVPCASSTIQIYTPPPGGTGAATLVATKDVVDGAGAAVTISALAWDANRGMVWGAYADQVWLIDIGDSAVSGTAVATLQFNAVVTGLDLVDGLAYDPSDDTLYYSPDEDCCVHHFSLGTGANSPLGTLLNTVTPKDASGMSDGKVSGVAVGSGDTLYIGRDGDAEIRRIDKATGGFISDFATTTGRVEDLTCDPLTYAPKEAILAKHAYDGLYEAFEVEAGTCPLVGPPECAGEVATIVGTNGDDSLVGTPNRDVIQALDGDDTVTGLGGNDLICGGEGDDELSGGAGRDRLIGDEDDDSLFGGRDRDELDGANGADELTGGRGDDTLAGGTGQDDLVGGADDDELSGNAGADDLFGARGDDMVFGGPGTDDLNGGAGDDELSGENGDDDIIGGPGDDLLFGGFGDDQLSGTSGDDQLLGEIGDDELSGGTGNDSLGGGVDSDDCDGGFGTDTDTGCEVAIGFP
jgi:Ca2+-binding RTX toxin-like protein